MPRLLTLKRLEEICEEARVVSRDDETIVQIWDNQEDRWVDLLEEDIFI